MSRALRAGMNSDAKAIRDLWLAKDCVVTLRGKTGHGKNRVREHGDKWLVLGLPPVVMEMTPPPVFPFIKSEQTGEMRWFDDTNFEVV